MGRKRKKNYRVKKQSGGLLKGPSHAQGGIPAKIQNGGMVELEGGEYIINAQTVNAVGTEYLDKLNSTATTYHQGGFQQGQLGQGSLYKKGGKIRKRRYQEGGATSGQCPPGQHWMPAVNGQPGYCMQGAYHGANNGGSNGMNYKSGGSVKKKVGGRVTSVRNTSRRQRMKRGGQIRNSKFATGGNLQSGLQENMSFSTGNQMRTRRTVRNFTTQTPMSGFNDDLGVDDYKRGGKVGRRRKMQTGGSMNQCPPGQYMQGGQCVQSGGGTSMGGGYRRGGRIKRRR